VHDATLEALFRVLAKNPRGLTMILDELSTLVLGMNQYRRGAGNDRPNLLKIWSRAPISIDRVANEFGEPIRIARPALCITGNATPSLLAAMGGGEDGFSDRWVYAYPDRRPKPKSADRSAVGDDTVAAWEAVARNLRRRDMVQDGDRTLPGVVHLSPAGKAELDRLHDAHVEEVNAVDFPDHLRGPWAKLEEYATRLALILTLLDHASDPTADPLALPRADVRSARSAWRLVNYFKAHHRRVRAALGGRGLAGAPEGVRPIRRWLEVRPGLRSFRESDLTRDFRALRDRAKLEDALAWLEKARAIRRVPEPARPRGTPGRKPAGAWEVHPDLRAPRNPENPEDRDADLRPACGATDSPDSPDLPAGQAGGSREGGCHGDPAR
jgi:hypothetical protein